MTNAERDLTIYNEYKRGNTSYRKLGKKYGMSYGGIGLIIKKYKDGETLYINYPDFRGLSKSTISILTNNGVTNKEELFALSNKPFNFGSKRCRELSLFFGVYMYIDRKGNFVIDKNKKVLPICQLENKNSELNCVYM